MSSEELLNIRGGSFSSIVTAIVGAIKTIYDFGQAVGSALRRVFEGKYCQIK